MNFQKKQKITILTMLLFLTSTILIATKTNRSFSKPTGMKLAATSTPLVYVNPPNITKSVGEAFTIDVVIADVTDLYAIDIQFKWDPSILEYVNHTLKIPVDTYADGILSEPGMFIKDEADGTLGTYWCSYASFDPAPAFDGTGTSFSMTFNPIKLGGCFLEFPIDPRNLLPYIELSYVNGTKIDYNWQVGYFETVGTPQASFTYQPQIGVVGKPISFNASESNTPSGTIVAYYWDFADLNTAVSTNAEITHAYNEPGLYSVSLIVENDAGVNSSKTVEQVIIVESRNIKIISVSPSTDKAIINSTVTANITVTNNGYANETFILAAYYNTSATEWIMIAITNVTNLKSLDTKEYSFIWNTTGVEAEKYYVIKVNATLVPYDDEADNTMISEPLFITSEIIHDLAVETLMLQASQGVDKFPVPVILGESALFTIGIKNNGTVPEESYSVVVYSNGTSLKDLPITDALIAGATKTLTYTYKSENISQRGLYNITAQVIISTDDNYTQNNQMQQMMRVIETPILNITYTPETLIMNQTIVLNASDSVHGDPHGQITSYYWKIFAPGQELEEIPQYESAESEISVSYKFIEQGNWTIVLRVKDNYGITYSGTRGRTGDYKLEEEVIVTVEGDGENGEDGGGIPLEYIAIIIVVVVAAIVAFVLVRRRRSGLTPTE
jgi:PKD repeat protein